MMITPERARTSLRSLLRNPLGSLRHNAGLPLVLLASIALVAACAAPPDKYTAADIQQASTSGNLAALYDQIEADLKDPALGETQRQTMQLRLSEAGRTLAQGSAKEVRAAVQSSALPDGLVPLKVYDAQASRLESIKRWDAATFQRVSTEITDGKKKTEEAIAAGEAQLAGLSDSQVDEKLALMDQLGALNGAGTDEQVEYAEQKVAILKDLREKANTAIENEDFSDAQRMLATIAAVNPADQQVDEKLVEVDAKLFEQRFYDALANDRPDDAYQALVTLSEAPNFEKVRPRLSESADVMADHFVTLGSSASQSKQWRNAFRWFTQSRDIRERLGLSQPGELPQEKPLIQEMHRRYEKARKKEMYGLAWGYLNVIEVLQPDSPKLRRDLRETREEVLQKAVKRVSAARFEDHHRGSSEFGDTVTAEIVQYLFQHLSEDVRIIEREKLAEIEQERGLSKEAAQLQAVDYLIQGNILEAKIDATERNLSQRKRVTTGKERVSNPDWDRWTSMSEKERDRAGMETPPTTTIERDRVEDVQIDQIYHRKVGVFSVSYRVIDADNAKVIFADTQRVKEELEGTDSPAIDIGDFKQEAQVANLPTDSEILEKLAEEISQTVGQKLAAVLVDPELQYEKDADRSVREGNFVGAAEQYAYAVVLSDRKQKDSSKLSESLRESAVAAAPVD